MKRIDDLLAEFELNVDWSGEPPSQGRYGTRSRDFSTLHDEMVAVLQIDPLANW